MGLTRDDTKANIKISGISPTLSESEINNLLHNLLSKNISESKKINTYLSKLRIYKTS